jgi:CubicO group peptidase (beta-lactamase class C family)
MKTNLFLAGFIAAILWCSFTSKASAQQLTANTEALVDTVFAKYNNKSGPGCTIAVIRAGKVIFEKAYGLANLEYNIPLTAESVFDIASLSKQFTGLCVSMLVQEGKIAEQDDIHKYLPWVPDFGHTITVHHLLHHTSGIRDWPGTLAMAGWKYEEEASMDEILRMVKNQRDLNFVPGSQFSYSNTGYNLLVAIIEKISGQSFDRFVDSAIFQPLDMRHSQFVTNRGAIIKDLATSYTPDHTHFRRIQDVLTAVGSSSLYSTLNDLTKWVIHFQKALDAKDPVYLRMLEGDRLNDGSANDYGYGVEADQYKGLKRISHTGAWAGYRTQIRVFPDENLAFITLCNADDDELSWSYGPKITDLLLRDKIKETPAAAFTKGQSVKLSSAILNRYAGKYKWWHGEIELSNERDTLFFQYTGEGKYALAASSDTSFYLIANGVPLNFKDRDTFTFRSSVGTRFIPWYPTTGELSLYTGTFYSKELKTVYQFDVETDHLVMHHFRRGDFNLDTDMKDQFTSEIGTLDFFYGDKGEIEGFRLSDDNVLHVRFDKFDY